MELGDTGITGSMSVVLGHPVLVHKVWVEAFKDRGLVQVLDEGMAWAPEPFAMHGFVTRQCTGIGFVFVAQ
jgi:hypothetical protein